MRILFNYTRDFPRLFAREASFPLDRIQIGDLLPPLFRKWLAEFVERDQSVNRIPSIGHGERCRSTRSLVSPYSRLISPRGNLAKSGAIVLGVFFRFSRCNRSGILVESTFRALPTDRKCTTGLSRAIVTGRAAFQPHHPSASFATITRVVRRHSFAHHLAPPSLLGTPRRHVVIPRRRCSLLM